MWRTVALLAMAGGYIAKYWDAEQSNFYNMIHLLPGKAVLPVDWTELSRLPLEQQQAELNSVIATNEAIAASPWATQFLFGDDCAAATFGPKATRLSELQIESSDGSGWQIPVICAWPRDAERAPNGSLPLVLHFHSGGMIIGSVAQELPIVRAAAIAVHAVVCSVEYRMAPTHPHPAGVYDARDVGLALLGQKSPLLAKLGKVTVDRTRFATWGFSAGGYLSACVSRHLAHAGKTATVQVSAIPMAKPFGGTPSVLKWADCHWGIKANMYAWSALLPNDDGTIAGSWEASLLVDPPTTTLERLPPAYIQVHTQDVLRDEGVMYAQRLQTQGKLVRLDEFDTGHIGGLIGRFSKGGPGEDAHYRQMQVLRQALHGTSD